MPSPTLIGLSPDGQGFQRFASMTFGTLTQRNSYVRAYIRRSSANGSGMPQWQLRWTSIRTCCLVCRGMLRCGLMLLCGLPSRSSFEEMFSRFAHIFLGFLKFSSHLNGNKWTLLGISPHSRIYSTLIWFQVGQPNHFFYRFLPW